MKIYKSTKRYFMMDFKEGEHNIHHTVSESRYLQGTHILWAVLFGLIAVLIEFILVAFIKLDPNQATISGFIIIAIC